ncbi:unnamed protein product [Calypogeia fissa]
MALVEVSSSRSSPIGATSYGFFGQHQCPTSARKVMIMSMSRTGYGSFELPTRMLVMARSSSSSSSNGGGGDGLGSSAGRGGGGEGLLSGKEFFESFLRRRQAAGDGDFVSKAADVLREKEVVELDEESRQQVREKLSQLQKLNEVDDTGSFLKLSRARSWSLGQDVTPMNAYSGALDRETAREDRRQQSLLEYEALKVELSSMTIKVAVAVSAYCLIILSPEAMVSYGIGAIASLAYLQLLYRHVDDVSEDNVAQVFVERRPKRIGITSADLEESFEKFIRGSSRALSSPRLVIPSALFGLWALTEHFAENSPFHLQVAPLFFGFFAYKAAALVQTYQDNKDVFSMLVDSKDPEDS